MFVFIIHFRIISFCFLFAHHAITPQSQQIMASIIIHEDLVHVLMLSVSTVKEKFILLKTRSDGN